MRLGRRWVVAAIIVGLAGVLVVSWPAASGSASCRLHGRITTADGAPLPGVTVELSGGLPAQVTDEQGEYSVAVTGPPAEHTVTPCLEGYSFRPPQRRVWTSGAGAEASFEASPTDEAAASLPDLAVSTFTVTAYPPPATRKKITVVVTNRGAANVTRAFYVGVWSSRATAPTDWRGATWERKVPRLAKGAKVTYTFVFPAKTNSKAWVFVDSHLAIKESSEKNNKVGKSYTAVVTKLADLVVSHLSVAPNPATLQQQVTATVRVKNQGNLAAGAFTVGFWRDGHVGNPDHEWQVAGLAAGAETADLTFQFTLNDQAPGAQHVAWAEADRAKQVPESNENNNTLTYNYKSQTEGQAELLCSDMAVQPDPVGLGGTVTITVKVLNQGGKAAGAFQIAAWKNRASPSPPTDDTGSDHLWNVAGLDPLAETPYLTWDYPAASAGAFTCWVLADCKLMVPESNENNNYASDSYTIIGPDCIVSFLQVTPDPSTLGDQLTVSVRGKNIGNAAIPVATCPKISFWKNLTTPPTNDAGEDHSWTFCGLAVNQETQTFTWNFTPAAAGNYDAWALIDSTDIVHELDETNNTKDDLYAVNNP